MQNVAKMYNSTRYLAFVSNTTQERLTGHSNPQTPVPKVTGLYTYDTLHRTLTYIYHFPSFS